MYDCINFSDVCKELVAKALAFGCAFNKSFELYISPSCLILSSGTATIPTLGSIVQKGKLAACAPAFVSELNKVDLPTFGKPTIPNFIIYSSPLIFLYFTGFPRFVYLTEYHIEYHGDEFRIKFYTTFNASATKSISLCLSSSVI